MQQVAKLVVFDTRYLILLLLTNIDSFRTLLLIDKLHALLKTFYYYESDPTTPLKLIFKEYFDKA